MNVLHALLKQIDNLWHESLDVKNVSTFLLHTVACIVDLSFDRQAMSSPSIVWVSTLSVSFLVRMTRCGREHLAKRIVQHYTTIANRKKIVTISHLMAENLPAKLFTISSTIMKRSISSDTSSGVAAREKFWLVNEIVSKDRWTIELEFRCEKLRENPMSIEERFNRYWIEWKCNIASTKRHLVTQRSSLRKCQCALFDCIVRWLLSSDFGLIMDDETIFTLINESVSSNCGFYTTDPDMSPPEVMVWIALSEKGISEPFFAKQHQSINAETYLEHCI